MAKSSKTAKKPARKASKVSKTSTKGKKKKATAKSNNIAKLKTAGLRMGKVTAAGKKRLESLSERDLQDLIAILGTVTGDNSFMEFKSNGFQRRSHEE
jgi:hypothetical protein